MSSKRKKTEVAGGRREFVIPPEQLDQIVKGPMTQSEVETACRALKKAVIERTTRRLDGPPSSMTQRHNLPSRRAGP